MIIQIYNNKECQIIYNYKFMIENRKYNKLNKCLINQNYNIWNSRS